MRWNETTELATFDYFDINAILSIWRGSTSWPAGRISQLDAARGREIFARLLAELDEGADRQEINNKKIQ